MDSFQKNTKNEPRIIGNKKITGYKEEYSIPAI